MLRVLEWYDGSMNLGLSHGVRKSCLGKVGIWGGDALGEKTGLSAMSVLLSYPAALCILSSERRAFSRGLLCLIPGPVWGNEVTPPGLCGDRALCSYSEELFFSMLSELPPELFGSTCHVPQALHPLSRWETYTVPLQAHCSSRTLVTCHVLPFF